MSKFTPYPHLFEPVLIRGKEVRNRVVASPHSGGPNLYRSNGDGCGNLTETGARYFAAVARGGAAIVHSGHLGVDPRYYLGMNEERFNFFSMETIHEHGLPTLHMMTDLIHAYGSLASIELNHCGHYGRSVNGEDLLGPDDLVMPSGQRVRAMTEEDMDEVAEYFANAAWIGKRGGFDMINVHAAHNWLLGEFFSPVNNHRTDKYGGSPANRARFPRMVLERIRQRIGDDMLLQMRFSVDELVEGGITLDEAAWTLDMLSDIVDVVQCSAGKIHNPYTTGFLFPMPYMQHGCNAHLAGEMKRRLGDKLIFEAIGGINEPEMAEKLVAEGTTDLVGMARSFIADPEWANKAREGRPEDIRPCIRCLRCLNYAIHPQTGTSVCTVNPRRVLPEPLPEAEHRLTLKKVAVIGGGPAGMQAAQELAHIGHQVVLFEQSGEMGGRLLFADHVVFKDDLRRYREYLRAQVEKSPNLEVRLNTQATPEAIRDEEFDAAVVAIGAEEYIPAIPGAEGPNVRHVNDIFGHEAELGQKLVIIGGGFVGCEATVHLQSLGKEVDVVEMQAKLMADGADLPDERFFTKYYMHHEFKIDNYSFIGVPEIDRVRVHLNSACVEITPEGAWIEDERGQRSFLPADQVIMATGFQPDAGLRDAFRNCAPLVVSIGDCQKAGDLLNTSRGGLSAAMQIS